MLKLTINYLKSINTINITSKPVQRSYMLSMMLVVSSDVRMYTHLVYYIIITHIYVKLECTPINL